MIQFTETCTGVSCWGHFGGLLVFLLLVVTLRLPLHVSWCSSLSPHVVSTVWTLGMSGCPVLEKLHYLSSF